MKGQAPLPGMRIELIGLIPGEQLEVIKHLSKGRVKKFTCTVINESQKFVTVNKGNYRDTLDKFDIQKGLIEIIREGQELKKKIEMPSKEQFLEECKQFLSKTKAATEIAKARKISPSTVYKWFKDYDIDVWEQSQPQAKIAAETDPESSKAIPTEESEGTGKEEPPAPEKNHC